ncbi:MAG: hypothetical protein HW421_760 [Ignavibacteria bacterium]|nr:hypothetical protein [Ignavibacteria bacterium]
MNNSKLIHEYLDGGLSQSERDELFSQLGTDTVLRNEFDSQVKLQLIARSDMNSITPPIESTASIFSSLGFSIPNGNSGQTTGIMGSSGGSWLKRYALPVGAAALLTVLMTTLTFMFLQVDFSNKDNGSSANRDNVKTNGSSLAVQSDANAGSVNSSKADIPVSSNITLQDEKTSGQASENNASLSKSIESIKRNVRVNADKTTKTFRFARIEKGNSGSSRKSISSNISNEQDLTVNSDMAYNALNRTANSSKGTNGRSQKPKSGKSGGFGIPPSVTVGTASRSSSASSVRDVDLPGGYNGYSDDILIPVYDSTKISVNLNFSSGASPTQLDLQQTLPWYSGFGINALYKFNRYFAAGFEIGCDNFAQKFNFVKDGKLQLYQQNPLLVFYGASLRLTAPDLILGEMIIPYTKLLAGNTIVGPYGKFEIGSNFEIFNHIYLSVAYQGSLLVYPMQDQFLNSFKYGWVYGLNYNF